jgi:hypothetical protein
MQEKRASGSGAVLLRPSTGAAEAAARRRLLRLATDDKVREIYEEAL